jgi:hypothetical protein
MAPLQLTDEEKDLLMALSQPIDHRLRSQFLAAVAAELEARGGACGPGVVHQVARTVQRKFWDPPRLREDPSARRHA